MSPGHDQMLCASSETTRTHLPEAPCSNEEFPARTVPRLTHETPSDARDYLCDHCSRAGHALSSAGRYWGISERRYPLTRPRLLLRVESECFRPATTGGIEAPMVPDVCARSITPWTARLSPFPPRFMLICVLAVRSTPEKSAAERARIKPVLKICCHSVGAMVLVLRYGAQQRRTGSGTQNLLTKKYDMPTDAPQAAHLRSPRKQVPQWFDEVAASARGAAMVHHHSVSASP